AAIGSTHRAQRGQMARWARTPKSSQALALRSSIVLAALDGASNTEVTAVRAYSTAPINHNVPDHSFPGLHAAVVRALEQAAGHLGDRRSTWLIQDEWVGVTCMANRGWAATS
ncbi:MAG: hypothetical protein QM662_13860, partial [Gordonia sp. (in: high G+C Gram-positive bacteria)]